MTGSPRTEVSRGRGIPGIRWLLRGLILPVQLIDNLVGWPFTEPDNRWRRKANWIGRRATARVWFQLMRLSNRYNRASVLGGGPPVSLTTYGSRIPICFATVESIGLGSLRPKRLVLWLDETEDPVRLDPRLQRLVSRGLEVRHTTNYGPHKKYYPFVRDQWDGDTCLVTADDDIIYPPNWLKLLWQAHLNAPEAVNCHRARIVQVSGRTIGRYADWPAARTTDGSAMVFATGTSGVIYPPRLLGALKDSQELFVELCPRADDIWLHAAAVENDIPVRQIRRDGRHFPVVNSSQTLSLQNDNVAGSGNDRQIAATYPAAAISRIAAAQSAN